MSEISNILVGPRGTGDHLNIKIDPRVLRKYEGRLFRASMLAVGFAIAALYAANNFEEVTLGEQVERIAPTPLM